MAQNANIVAYPQKIIVSPTTQKVDVIGATQGPAGPQGIQGIPGPVGPVGPAGDPAPSDHGLLTGLGDDDHPQYLTEARGDARYSILSHNHDSRYYTESESDSRFVNSSGDTMTGNLTLTSASLITNNNSPTVYFQDTDHRSAMIHVNSNVFYVLRGSGTNSLSWSQTGGRWPLQIDLENNNATFGNVIYSHSLRGHSNVAGTGEAIHTPAGIYSTGTNWLYGQIITNGNTIDVGNGTIYAGNWFRSTGVSGWYSQTYGGGIFMQDTTWVRVYNGKDFYSNGGRIAAYVTTTSNDWEVNPIQARGANDIGVSIRSYDSDTHTLQLRSSDGICYLRSHNDGSYKTLAAIMSSQSSRTIKQDVRTWGSPSSAGSMVDPTYSNDGVEVVRRLRPVTYRFKKQDALPRDLETERRSKALDRLNSLRSSRGLDAFYSDEVIHLCGRDCEWSEEDPCPPMLNWQRGTIGFIAEEVGEVIPQATDIDLRKRSATHGQNTGIDPLAISAVLVKAVQELDQRISNLEEVR